jgi:3-oxoacyl-[acyl-carrier protein] reductase
MGRSYTIHLSLIRPHMPDSQTPPKDISASTTASPLTGSTALVTGASSGIGRAIALRLAELGASLLLVARDTRALEAVKQHIAQLGGAAETVPCDLTSASAIAGLRSRIDAAGGCDILINAAGIGRIGAPLHEMALEDFDAVLATNLRAPFLLMHAVVPGMIARGSGHIVNISSLAGQGPLANGAAYAASKWALNGLSYSAAEELRGYDIRVSVVAPGSVNTEFGRGGKDRTKMLQPEDVAGVVAMLVTQPPQSFISEVRMRPTRKP